MEWKFTSKRSSFLKFVIFCSAFSIICDQVESAFLILESSQQGSVFPKSDIDFFVEGKESKTASISQIDATITLNAGGTGDLLGKSTTVHSDEPCSNGEDCIYESNDNDDTGAFYAMIMVATLVSLLFVFCAGILTCILMYCFRHPVITGTRRSSSSESQTIDPEVLKPPPNFEDALKCSKVEYSSQIPTPDSISIDDESPPIYSSLKF